MKEFFADNHYPNEATFSECPQSKRNLLNSVVTLYSLKTNSMPPLLLDGPNVNSLNFKYGDFYLKILTDSDDKKYVSDFPKISDVLEKSGIPTQTFIPSIRGIQIENLKIGDQSYLVYVQPFLAATFYTGTKDEFSSSLKIISKLITVSKLLENVSSNSRI